MKHFFPILKHTLSMIYKGCPIVGFSKKIRDKNYQHSENNKGCGKWGNKGCDTQWMCYLEENMTDKN